MYIHVYTYVYIYIYIAYAAAPGPPATAAARMRPAARCSRAPRRATFIGSSYNNFNNLHFKMSLETSSIQTMQLKNRCLLCVCLKRRLLKR